MEALKQQASKVLKGLKGCPDTQEDLADCP